MIGIVLLFLLLIVTVIWAKRQYVKPLPFDGSGNRSHSRSRSILSALGGPRVYGDYMRHERDEATMEQRPVHQAGA